MNVRNGSVAGIAAVMVFGIGNLIVGSSLPPGTHDRAASMIYGGFTLVAVAAFFTMLMIYRDDNAGQMLIGSIAAVLCGVMLFYHATKNEITGTAVYRFVGKHSRPEAVTRDDSPAKFRTATDFLWGAGLGCLGVSAITFTFYRKLEE